MRAAASFFSRYLNLIWKIIFRCAEISGIYRVGLIFGYTKKGVEFGKRFLRGFQLKERFPEPSACDPCAQLLYVKSHGKDEEPRFVVLFTSGQEASEAVILLQYPENTFDLNGPVHAQENSFGVEILFSASSFWRRIVLESSIFRFSYCPLKHLSLKGQPAQLSQT